MPGAELGPFERQYVPTDAELARPQNQQRCFVPSPMPNKRPQQGDSWSCLPRIRSDPGGTEVESWQPFKLNHRGSFPPRIKIERASRTSHAVREVPRGDISPERMQGPGSRISYSIRADAHCCSDRSGTHFEDHIERCLGRAAEAPEARFSRDLTQSAFTRLGAEPQAHFLRE